MKRMLRRVQRIIPDPATALLLHFDGADGSVVTTDSSVNANVLTNLPGLGSCVLDTSVKKFGSSSCNDNQGCWTFPYKPYMDQWWANDWTVDLWFRWGAVIPASAYFLAQYNGLNYMRFYYTSSGKFFWNLYDGTNQGEFESTVAFTPTVGQWYHLAFVRASSVPYLFIDGVSQSVTVTAPYGGGYYTDYSTFGVLGAGTYGAGYCIGHADEFRWSIGVARWTSNFTPPTSPY